MKKNKTTPFRNETASMKNQGYRKASANRSRKRYIQTTAVILTAIAVLTGVIVIAALGRRASSAASSSSESEILYHSDSASTQTSSDSISASTANSSLPASSSKVSSAVPTPTKAQSNASNLPVSTTKDGWWYSPGKSQGIPSTTSAAHMAACDRFDGIWQGDTTKKVVYITMDCGYDYNNNTAKILDIAKEKNFKITFFLTGAMFETPALKAVVLRMVDEGHLVGNHTWDHPSLPDMLNKKGAEAVNAEIDKVEAAFKDLTGKEIAHYMRPPMGEFSEATMQMMQARGYKTVFWSFAHKDWVTDAQPTRDAAWKAVTGGLHNGTVYLLHTVSNTNVEILPDLIDYIRAQGYELALVNSIK